MDRSLGLTFLFLATGLVLVPCEISCPEECDCSERMMKGKMKKVIDCSDRGLDAVPSFMGLAGQSFDYLLLNKNEIHNLQARAFRGLTVKHLDISDNDIRGVSDNAFKSLSGLQELRAENAGLSSVPLALGQLTHLRILKLKDNNIHQLNTRVFANLGKLHYLDASNNKLDFAYPFTGFQTLKELKTLKLAGCEIDNMPVDALEDVSAKLKVLDLSSNNIRDIPNGVLQKMYKLETLNLENNPITFQQNQEYFKGLTNLKVLKLGRCDMGGTLNKSIVRDNRKLRTLTVHTCKINKVEKDFFSSLKHLQNLDIGGNRLELSMRLFIDVGPRLLSVGLSNMSLTEVPRHIWQSFSKVKNISLAHNKIRNLQPGSFSNLDHANTRIQLNDNGITSVHVHFLRKAGRPITLDLSNNSISNMEFLTADPCNLADANIDLTNNPLSCDPACGIAIAMQKKAFNVTGACAGPRGVIGYLPMWKPGFDPLPRYLELNKSEECGLENRQDQRYLCCEKDWVPFDSTETCGTSQTMAAFYLHFVIVLLITLIIS